MRRAKLTFWAVLLLSAGMSLHGCQPSAAREKVEKKQPAEKTTAVADPLERLASRLEREVSRKENPKPMEREEEGKTGLDSEDSDQSFSCPKGTELVGAPPPKGKSLYCAKPTAMGVGGGVKNGPYVKWDDDGTKRYEASFANDELDGPATTYDPEGQVAEYQEYQRGIRSGRWEKWNRSGQKVVTGFFSGGKKDGHFKYWDRSGALVSEGTFRRDVKSGLWTFYDHEGVIRSKYNFVDGKKEGKAQTFYENGRVASVGTFKDNKPDGQWTYFTEEGRQKTQGEFVAGRKSGRWTDFDEYGRVVAVRNFHQGRVKKGSEGPEMSTPGNKSGFVSM